MLMLPMCNYYRKIVTFLLVFFNLVIWHYSPVLVALDQDISGNPVLKSSLILQLITLPVSQSALPFLFHRPRMAYLCM
jgi:hypothetical protein